MIKKIKTTLKADNKIVKVNSVANLTGNTVKLLLHVLLAPLYIHLLGIENFGVIGFYMAISGFVAFLELGLGRVCSREVAFLSGKQETSYAISDTLRTFEILFWSCAVLIGVILTILAFYMSSSWLSSSELPQDELLTVLNIMGWLIAVNWPKQIYIATLTGLQKQLHMNMMKIGVALAGNAGAVLVLLLIKKSLFIFFVWQLAFGSITTLFFLIFTWKYTNGSFFKSRVQLSILERTIRLSLEIALNKLLIAILSNTDKLLVSALLSLKQFAYYSLATSVVSVMGLLASPLSTGVFPRFSQMSGSNVTLQKIRNLFQSVSEWVSFLTIPTAFSIAFFSFETLYVYTGDIKLASNTANILSILILARMLYNFLAVPFVLQISFGWMKVNIIVNSISVICYVPLTYWLVKSYGALGGAFSFFCMAFVNTIIITRVVHRRLLRDNGLKWAKKTLLLPIVTNIGFLIIVRTLISPDLVENRIMLGGLLLTIGFSSLLITSFTLTSVKAWLLNLFKPG